jgi:hypothetical protein
MLSSEKLQQQMFWFYCSQTSYIVIIWNACTLLTFFKYVLSLYMNNINIYIYIYICKNFHMTIYTNCVIRFYAYYKVFCCYNNMFPLISMSNCLVVVTILEIWSIHLISLWFYCSQTSYIVIIWNACTFLTFFQICFKSIYE